MSEGTWRLLAVVSVAGLVMASYGTAYFYEQSASIQSDNDYLRVRLSTVSYKVNVGVDFGNGSRVWFNGTYVPVGSSVFNATFISTGGRMTSQVYRFGNVSSVFVMGILGVSGSSTAFWLWYHFDNSSRGWVEAPVGANSYLATEGGTYLWNFTRG